MIIHDVEQNSEEWHALRAGKPTASAFAKIVTSKGEPSKSQEGYVMQLAADKIAGFAVDPWEGNQWTERGHEMEDRARAWYELEFPNRSVQKVGFITDDAERIGASPDSIVVDGNQQGSLEIKCLKGSSHVETHMYFQKHGRMPPKYVQQTQGQMQVGELAFNDLLFWHPELPALLIRTYPDVAFLKGLTIQLGAVINWRDDIVAHLDSIK